MKVLLLLLSLLPATFGFPELDAFIIAAVKHSERRILHMHELKYSKTLDPIKYPSFSMSLDKFESLHFSNSLLTGLAHYEVERVKAVDLNGSFALRVRFPSLNYLTDVQIQRSKHQKVEEKFNPFIIQFLQVRILFNGRLEKYNHGKKLKLRVFQSGSPVSKRAEIYSTSNGDITNIVADSSEKIFKHALKQLVYPFGVYLRGELQYWLRKHTIQDIRIGELTIGDDVPSKVSRLVKQLTSKFFNVQLKLHRLRAVFEGDGNYRVRVHTKNSIFVFDISLSHRDEAQSVYQVHSRVDDVIVNHIGNELSRKSHITLHLESVRHIFVVIFDNLTRHWSLKFIRLAGIHFAKGYHGMENTKIMKDIFSILLVWTNEALEPLIHQALRH